MFSAIHLLSQHINKYLLIFQERAEPLLFLVSAGLQLLQLFGGVFLLLPQILELHPQLIEILGLPCYLRLKHLLLVFTEYQLVSHAIALCLNLEVDILQSLDLLLPVFQGPLQLLHRVAEVEQLVFEMGF